jgi:hypothetical protein
VCRGGGGVSKQRKRASLIHHQANTGSAPKRSSKFLATCSQRLRTSCMTSDVGMPGIALLVGWFPPHPPTFLAYGLC